MGNVLKQSSAASSGAGSATWGLYADYYAALGFHASAREALLKQVRSFLPAFWVLLGSPLTYNLIAKMTTLSVVCHKTDMCGDTSLIECLFL